MALKTSAAAWAIRVVKTGEQTETLAISAVLFVLAIKWVYYNRYRKTMYAKNKEETRWKHG